MLYNDGRFGIPRITYTFYSGYTRIAPLERGEI